MILSFNSNITAHALMSFFNDKNSIIQCLEMYSLCAFGTKPAKGLVILVFVLVVKRYTHELYIFRYCTDIVYVMCFYSKTVCLVINIDFNSYSLRFLILTVGSVLTDSVLLRRCYLNIIKDQTAIG